MVLTKEMVMNLNIELGLKGCPFRYKYSDDMIVASMEIILPSMNCVDSFIVNPTKKFFDWLRLWFKEKYNIELNCNNTGSIMWSNDFGRSLIDE